LKKRLHRNIIQAIETGLQQIFEEKIYADRVLEHILKSNPLWGSRDRRQIAETTYDIVRWWRRICFAAKINENDPLKYRKALTAWYLIKQEYEITEWLCPIEVSEKELVQRYHAKDLKRDIRESIPEWLDSMCANELGDIWDDELHALNEQADLILRVNSIKTSHEDLKKILSAQTVESQKIKGYKDALLIPTRINVFKLAAFKEGLFEIQDASSQLVAPFIDAQAGMRVIDACAGGGGKSLHIAAQMNNKGRVIAMDVEQWKLDELKKRARRGGISIIETRAIDNTKAIKRLYDSADRLLLDVPCSGLGVLRRNPDAKWKLSADFIAEMQKKQIQILSDYSRMVKIGGKIVYATCSILPSENTLQVQKFLQSNENFQLEEEKIVLPSQGFDGFYMARLVRKS
jgi:16S rRNA (cytosine967-C5)-methyltransferase